MNELIQNLERSFGEKIVRKIPECIWYGFLKKTTNNGNQIWVSFDDPNRQLLPLPTSEIQAGISVKFGRLSANNRHTVSVVLVAKYRYDRHFAFMLDMCKDIALNEAVSYNFINGNEYFFDKMLMARVEDIYVTFSFDTEL